MTDLIVPLAFVGALLSMPAFLIGHEYSAFKQTEQLCEDNGGAYHKLDTGFVSTQRGCVIDGEFYAATSDATVLFKR